MRAGLTAAPLLAFPLVLALAAFRGPGGAPVSGEAAVRTSPLPALEARAEVLGRGIGAVEEYHREEVLPVERALSRFSDDQERVRRIAFALVREGRRAGVSPRVLASVLLVENPWLAPDATSFVGAVGLMQVMPVHAGSWGCGSADLTDLDANICHGARIFAHYLERSGGDVERALLRYNGCVRGTNTPDCHRYPAKIYAQAGRAAVLDWLGPGGP